jgi:nitroreductase
MLETYGNGIASSDLGKASKELGRIWEGASRGGQLSVDFWQLVSERKSIREYLGSDIPQEGVERILRAAIRAPSAGNRQPWQFLVVRSPALKRELAQAAGQGFIAQAPVVIVVCTEPGRSAQRYGRRGVELYCLQDTAAAVEHILLGAVALGLGACWVGAFHEGEVARALGLTVGLRPIALIPLGYPARPPGPPSPRRPLDEVVRFLD